MAPDDSGRSRPTTAAHSPRSDAGAGGLQCADCGHRYGYLGSEPHPGRCPACDSRAVPPAGDLELTAGRLLPAWAGVDLRFRDASGRVFAYALTAVGPRTFTILEATVDGTAATADPGPDSPLVDDGLGETLADLVGTPVSFTPAASAGE